MKDYIHMAPISIMNFFFMLGLSVILAVDSTLFERGNSEFYNFLLALSPQIGFSAAAFVASVLLFFSFILKNAYVQIMGLFLSGSLLLLVLAGYLLDFPSIAGVGFAIWTLGTFMTIVDILNQLEDEKERKEYDNR